MNARILRWLLTMASIALLGAALYLHSQPALVTAVVLAVVAAALAIAASMANPTEVERRLRERAEPHLDPGEMIQVALPAFGGPGPYLTMIVFLLAVLVSLATTTRYGRWVTTLLLFVTPQWSIVATDRAILLLRSFPGTREVLEARLPRYTRLGPVSGRWAMIALDGKWMFVHRRFHANVELADSVIAPDWIPERSGPPSDRPRRGRTNVSLRSRGRHRGA